MKRSIVGTLTAAVLLLGAVSAAAAAEQTVTAGAPANKRAYQAPAPGDYPKPPADYSITKGEWKAFVPKGVKGQFDSYDPIGLIAGQLIKADCSINWRDQNGKLYCFSSGTSLVYFQDFPHGNIRKAAKAYEQLTGGKAGS